MKPALPCPACGRSTGGRTPCPHCGVAYSPSEERTGIDPVPADFTRVLVVLGVAAGLLIGAAVGWRAGAGPPEPVDVADDSPAGEAPPAVDRPDPRVEDDGAELDAPGGRDPIAEVDDDDTGPGMTAAELLAQEELVEPTGPVAVVPPELDVSDAGGAPALVASNAVARAGWYEGAAGYERARLERSRRDAPLIVYFHTDWCAYCRRLDEEFLANDAVAGWLNRSLRVAINPEDGDAELALARTFGIGGYPGFFVLRPGSEEARRVHPFRRGRTISTAQFLEELKTAAGEG